LLDTQRVMPHVDIQVHVCWLSHLLNVPECNWTYSASPWGITSMICVQKKSERWTSQGSLSCYCWMSVWSGWTATDVTHSCMPGCEYILPVTPSWLICVCRVFFLCVVSKDESLMVVFRAEGNSRTEMLVREIRNNPLTQWSCRFTLLDIFWSNVREHVNIPPFHILLVDEFTEI
jgi:hypothetical protein